ncbi:MAG: hypothetical protein NUV86_09630 [Candidatus Scalindua sp.]|nr:hypothetical protein [Candidatus Scalindua sp.]MCR4345216.1 hypothetical protein [Candidatus Scalindua sp.]
MTTKPNDVKIKMDKFKSLEFGTSGLRDKVTAMTDMECYINTRGFIMFLEERGELNASGKDIALGGDLRSSTPRIMSAVSLAIKNSGYRTLFCGRVPTPTLAYYAMYKCMPSIMVTGSHIPDDRNGIKFTKKSGEVLKTDEDDILRNVEYARTTEYEKPLQESLFDKKGMFKEEYNLPEAEFEMEAINIYVHRYTDVFKNKPLSRKKIVLYQHSAVGRDIVQEIFEGLGADVVPIERSNKFVAVDTEKVSIDTTSLLQKASREHKPFAIITTDGDSDRPLLADENGRFLPGDKLGALISIFLSPDFVAIPISANDAVVSSLEERGIKVMQTRIGSPYVIDAMNSEIERNPGSKVAGWECNGGFLLGSDWSIDNNTLKSLPTRDAVLPLICVLLLAAKGHQTVSELVTSSLPDRYTHSDVIDDKTPGCESYTAEMGKTIIKMLSPENSDISQVDFTEEGIKANGVDCSTGSYHNLTLIKEKLYHYFTKERGFTDIVSINFIDGIRIVFSNNDVVHLRPSGNAPEFRIYATADTQEAANQIVEKRYDIVPDIISDIINKEGGE